MWEQRIEMQVNGEIFFIFALTETQKHFSIFRSHYYHCFVSFELAIQTNHDIHTTIADIS